MTYSYDQVAAKYLELRGKLDDIDAEAKRQKAKIKEQMNVIEAWFLDIATQQGLKNIPTMHGTAYWAQHHSAKVANREDFMNYVRNAQTWDLLDVRASKTGVKSFVAAFGVPPPGIDYKTVQVFNLRAEGSKEYQDE